MTGDGERIHMGDARIVAHGVVCRMEGERFGYLGWPSVARLGDGRLVAGASAYRLGHLCPFGRTALFFSEDEGASWSTPQVVNDSPLDDRDVGLLSLGGQGLLLSWFNLDIRYYRETFAEALRNSYGEDDLVLIDNVVDGYTEEMNARECGSFVRRSEDGGASWGPAVRVPVTAPHGPTLLHCGKLIYVGKAFNSKEGEGPILVYESTDLGDSWAPLATIAAPEGAGYVHFHEPHVVELANGDLLAQIRFQDYRQVTRYTPSFSIFQTRSQDCGHSWSPLRQIAVSGSPPHLLRLRSGALVSSFGRREAPFGQRAMVSRDDGGRWLELCLRDDGLDADLGYPCSVELEDGSILTVYYQRLEGDRLTSLLWTRWRLEDEEG